MPEVYYFESLDDSLLNKLRQELEKAFHGCRRIAVKLHFGEPGNKTAFSPEQVKPIINVLKGLGMKYFLFDSPVTYPSRRSSVSSYEEYAKEKGWDRLGDVVISDDFVVVKGNSMDYEVCKPLAEADGVLVISHFKGHCCAGLGGAIKNLGMGALTKKTKSEIHEGARPVIGDGCVQCKACERACPINGIRVTDKPEIIKCYGCSNCVYACKKGVLKCKVNYFDVLLAEGANAAQSKFKKFYYVSCLKNITRLCDCVKNAGELISEDWGWLISKDAVAIDRAAYDLVTRDEDVFLKYNKKSGTEQVKAAEKLGMGSSEYVLAE
ncbi:DUF362 domain-containing protein [Candidatus Woesearchaeota archaeon]|nr:MAG: DUF362 domain-containing protein [Candidatus Woesearchaeota archaeon]